MRDVIRYVINIFGNHDDTIHAYMRDVIKAIYEKGKEKHRENAKRLNDSQFGSIEPNRKPPHNTNKQHGHVLRDIENLKKDVSNFGET